ncbi:helix-hairpin-helix domain-containing protein [Oceanobacillus chungangensis]|uniref:DNA-binding protein n=1 Tax=Oceanobacillus chungangensis TaxID=1229152 RepID=A0A3D8Q091_9BACI|nr:helix-hairpin-helix domain-containing protein [Oceanobacillus chungangensis]RDW21247.1 DNA-binding protein [Oceanobacillus chungangensis]
MEQEQQYEEGNLPKNLAKPAVRALAGKGILRLEQVAECKVSELLALHGMGPKAVEQLRIALNEQGLAFLDET